MLNKDVALLMKEETISAYGYLEINPTENVTVDSYHEYKFNYECKTPIQSGGSLRITIPHFFSTPQLKNPELSGYVTLSSEDATKMSIKIEPNLSCPYQENGHTGRYGKSIFIYFNKGLAKGKKICITYGDQSKGCPGTRAPFFSCKVYFLTAIDPDGKRMAKTTGYYLLEEQNSLEITGKAAHQACIIIPTINQKKVSDGLLQMEDLHGNIDTNFEGDISLFTETPGIILPEKVTFTKADGGRKSFSVENKSGNDLKIEVTSKYINGISNPGVMKKNNHNVYWGEYHVHTYASDGLGTIKDALEYGRDQANLDFASIADHTTFTKEGWKMIQQDSAGFNDPGKFITFLGFEVTAQPGICDFCVISPNMELDISEIIEYKDIDPKYHSVNVKIEDFYKIMSDKEAIIIPHFHLGSGKIWDYDPPKNIGLVEIYSCWGSHEYDGCPLPSYGQAHKENTVHKLLEKGFRCGIVAGSDSHSGQTGKSDWLRTRKLYHNGLTAILAEDLTRNSLWEALKNRRTYATTGARIFLDFQINDRQMGSEIIIKKGDDININLKTNGTVTTYLIQIFKNNRIWKNIDVQSYPFPPEIGCKGIVKQEIIDTNVNENSLYYLRLTQIDGHIAWSSPIWVDVE